MHSDTHPGGVVRSTTIDPCNYTIVTDGVEIYLVNLTPREPLGSRRYQKGEQDGSNPHSPPPSPTA